MLEKINFRNSRGLNLVGDLYRANSDKGVILLHGFTGDRKESGRFTLLGEELQKVGFNCLSIDFGGSGESDDEIQNTNNQARDFRDAVSFFESKGIRRIGALGLSLGPIALLKNRGLLGNKVKAVVLWAPVTDKWEDYKSWRFEKEELESLEKNGFLKMYLEGKRSRNYYEISKQLIDEREQLDQRELLSGISLPIFIIHGNKDNLVPIDWSKSAMKYLPRGSRLEILEGEVHTFIHRREEAVRKSVEWFKERL